MESFDLRFCSYTAISHNTLQQISRSPNLNCRTKTLISQCHSFPPGIALPMSRSAASTAFNTRLITSSNLFPISQPDACQKSHEIRTPAATVADSAAGDSIDLTRTLQLGAPPATVADSASGDSIDLTRTLQLGAMFVFWYSLNICFNIYNKQVLKVYPFPATISAFQFGCGTVIALLMWTFKLHPTPKVNRSQFGAIFLLALGHTVGNLLTNISLGKVAVSFTHTIKAMEPFFAVLLSTLLLGEKPSIWIVSSLVPIVGGVALASFTEASFNWIGFGSAMASNLTNQSRNVYSKRVMVKEELDNINLLSIMTMISFLMLLPIAILLEGFKFSPLYFQYAASQGLNVKELCIKALLTGFCFHSYQQVSYNILGMVSPVTHSVGNCVKRVVVIVSSVIFFQTPVSPINAIGTAIALAGVFLYSRAKRIKSTAKIA